MPDGDARRTGAHFTLRTRVVRACTHTLKHNAETHREKLEEQKHTYRVTLGTTVRPIALNCPPEKVNPQMPWSQSTSLQIYHRITYRMRRMAKMKSATRMALVTGEMSDCMSGAEPGRAAWSSASVRPSSVRCLSPSPSRLSLAPLATVEDGSRGFNARGHTHLEPDAHAHGLPSYTDDPAAGAQRKRGLPLEAAQCVPTSTLLGCQSHIGTDTDNSCPLKQGPAVCSR